MRNARIGGAILVLVGLAVVVVLFVNEWKMPMDSATEQTQTEVQTQMQTETDTQLPMPEETVSYINPDGMTLAGRFIVPEGYTRIDCAEDSFGDFLRKYPVLPDGTKVHLYDGREKGAQNDHAAVLDMALVEGDLQQCADSVLRLYAEYLYETKQYDRMNFKLTNGFPLEYSKWRQGMRVVVDGNQTSWSASAESSDSKESFEKYLRFLFNYAGTLSMGSECEQADISDVQPGDVFLYSGSPGHVVMVLDVCENESGERAFLLGQGYMPAQQFHVLKNPKDEENPWYYADEVSYPFSTPEYTFDEGSFMRPGY